MTLHAELLAMLEMDAHLDDCAIPDTGRTEPKETSTRMALPPFPVDDSTLDLLDAAITGTSGPEGRSSVGDLCVLLSELGGSDTAAVESEDCGIVVLRDPQYHPDDILTALVGEVRRLRAGLSPNAKADS